MAHTITLSKDEALVLFEWLSREVDDRHGASLAGVLAHPGEYWALNALHCLLERACVAPADLAYAPAVQRARDRLAPVETELSVVCAAEESSAMRA